MVENRTLIGLRRADIVVAYTFLRIIVGVNYFNHGFTRIGNIPGFAQTMVDKFQGSMMPEVLVRINAMLVPPVELIVGLLITIGLFTRSALIACLSLMVMLMYGVTLIQDWDTATSQLVYDLILFVLLAGLGFNTFSIDYRFRSKRSLEKSFEHSSQSVVRFVNNFVKRRRSHLPSSPSYK